MSNFDECWHFIAHRRDVPLVQNREELEWVFNLIQGCKSYLEIGTAEGDSLYVLAHALWGSSPRLTYVDVAEKHTQEHREEILKILNSEKFIVHGVHGTSQHRDSIQEAAILGPYDVVFIDGAHDQMSVIADAMAYGHLAKKYIIFHDITEKDVRAAFDFYVSHNEYKDYLFYTKSENFGYGVVRL